jgi:cellulose biosynthesis protein BcsQ
LEYSQTIIQKRKFFDRLIGRTPISGVVAANQLITVWGTQGGVGCSTVTTILAKMLHQIGFSVMVIEATPTGGSLIRFMGKKPVSRGIDTISHNKDKLKAEMDSIRVNVVKGLSIYPRSGMTYNAQLLWQEDEARELYFYAKKHAAFVIVDAGHSLSDALGRAALSEADHIVSVFRSTPVGIDHSIRFHEHCRISNYAEKMIWLMNQAYRTSEKSDLEFLTGEKITNVITYRQDMEILEQGASIPKIVQEEIANLVQRILTSKSGRVF